MGKKIRMLFVWKVWVRLKAVSIVDRFAVCSETYISFEGGTLGCRPNPLEGFHPSNFLLCFALV